MDAVLRMPLLRRHLEAFVNERHLLGATSGEPLPPYCTRRGRQLLVGVKRRSSDHSMTPRCRPSGKPLPSLGSVGNANSANTPGVPAEPAEPMKSVTQWSLRSQLNLRSLRK
jgi:hypothetical protein